MKNIVIRLYIIYFKYFPLKSGKQFLSNFVTYVFGTFTVKTAENFFMNRIDVRSMNDRSYFIHTFEHAHVKDNIGQLQLGDTFVDIGANMGYMSLLASRAVGGMGKVYSYEPSIREYSKLLENIQVNRVGNIIPMNVALSDRNGLLNLSVSTISTGLNRVSAAELPDSQKLIVPAFRFDTIWSLISEADENIALMKIDVEGWELLVLRGMEDVLRCKKVKKIIMEITDSFFQENGYQKADIYKLLHSFGYVSLVNSNSYQYDEIFLLS
jgi:FkbM family methyltransferase